MTQGKLGRQRMKRQGEGEVEGEVEGEKREEGGK
jgi:hypothetical protein